jgi:hypothetical protein
MWRRAKWLLARNRMGGPTGGIGDVTNGAMFSYIGSALAPLPAALVRRRGRPQGARSLHASREAPMPESAWLLMLARIKRRARQLLSVLVDRLLEGHPTILIVALVSQRVLPLPFSPSERLRWIILSTIVMLRSETALVNDWN